MTDREERLEEALQRLAEWANAYPFEVFPEPNLAHAHEVLKAAGMSLDAISAEVIREVLRQVRRITADALHDQKADLNF